jgi:hypothetical protein
MKERKLKDETVVEELDYPITLEVHTKCPAKWKLIDMETGEEYVGTNEIARFNQWKRLDNA